MGTCDSDLSALAMSAMTHENVLESMSSHCCSCYRKAVNLHKLPQFKSLTGDRLVNSDIFNLLSETPVPKGVMSQCHGTLSSSEQSVFSEMPLSEGGWSVSSVFTTNPAELMLCLQVRQLFNSPPATLASICPGSFLLGQLCFQFVEFRHVVPEEQVIT